MAVKLDTDLYSIQEARGLVLQAKAAQAEYTKFDQNKVDRVVENMARAGAEAAAELAKMALEETGFGVYEHKVFKNIYNSRFMWQAIKDLKTVGVIGFDPEQKIIQIAQPMGVIAALVPVTHPTATVYFNSLIALKTGNAIVFSPHPRAPRSAAAAAQLMEKAARAAGAPPHLISCMENISLAGTNELMQQRDVALILGTGGAAMVQAVYHSGKPAITAGPGNVPVYVDRSCKDIAGVVRKIILSKTFDNGTPCASEQSIIADAPIARRLKTELRNQGAYFLSEKEKQALGSVVLRPDGSFAPEVVGQSPQKLAKLAGFSVPMSCRLLVAELDGVGKEEPLSAEILSTVIGFYTEENWQQGLKRCNQLLATSPFRKNLKSLRVHNFMLIIFPMRWK